MRYWLVLLLATTAALALSSAASGAHFHFRYCQRPGVAGQYVAATRNVRCSTAVAVSVQMQRAACIHKRRCRSHGFLCISWWGSFRDPFSHSFDVSHHGRCRRAGGRRIEFDWG